jgi:hypothetical protein
MSIPFHDPQRVMVLITREVLTVVPTNVIYLGSDTVQSARYNFPNISEITAVLLFKRERTSAMLKDTASSYKALINSPRRMSGTLIRAII